MKKEIVLFVLACLTACNPSAAPRPVKNIILMIGDGMGPQQVAEAVMAEKYLTQQHDGPFTALFRDAATAIVSTESASSVVTDSAAAATAMACGAKTWNDMLGITPDGKACRSILAMAKARGMATGLVSNTRLSHATPAAFAANAVSRTEENAIAKQIITEGQVDVLLDGGARHLIPSGTRFHLLPECTDIDPSVDGASKRTDKEDLIAQAKHAGYLFACTKQALNQLPATATKILGIFANGLFPHLQERRKIASIPTVPEMTRFALETLSRNPNGFFLMVEAGNIDAAGHENDAGTQLQETNEFGEAITVVRAFIQQHPDTLLLVTADHETGGYSLSYQLSTAALTPKEIPQRGTYTPRFANPALDVVQRHLTQPASYVGLLAPILRKLYPTDDPYTLSSEYPLPTAAADLQHAIQAGLGDTISLDAATHILTRKPRGTATVAEADPFPFCDAGWDEAHTNKLARVFAPYHYTTWATGNHSHTPVHLFAIGPKTYTEKVHGLLDNTEIFHLMRRAMEGE